MALVNSAFTVNVTPGAMPPTVHVSEYDIGRTYTVTINGQNGSAFNIPTGTTATVEGTLNGVIGFTTGATISGSNVSFTLTESMTAKSGKAWCKIKLTLNDEPIQTCAFVLAVDRAGVEADTVIGADGFDTIIQNAVDNYLDDHNIVIDPTLSVSGAAADAKVTGDEIGDLKSAFTLPLGATTDNKFVNPTNGELITNDSYVSSDYIYIGDCRRLKIKVAYKYTAGIAFYTYSKTYISGTNNSVNPVDYGTIVEYEVPTNAAYLRISKNKSYETFVQKVEIDTSYENKNDYIRLDIDGRVGIDPEWVQGRIVDWNETDSPNAVRSALIALPGRNCKIKIESARYAHQLLEYWIPGTPNKAYDISDTSEPYTVAAQFIRVVIYDTTWSGTITPASAYENATVSIVAGEEGLPSYYNQEIETVRSSVLKNSYRDGINIAFITDTHYEYNSDSEHIYDGDCADRQFKAITELANRTNIDLIVHGGDLIHGATVGTDIAFDVFKRTCDILKNANCPVVFVRGNHDDNTERNSAIPLTSVVTELDWLKRLNDTLKADVVHDSANNSSTYFYMDFPKKKTRIVFLDCYDYPLEDDGSGNTVWKSGTWNRFSDEQLSWFENEALSIDKTGWQVVVMLHGVLVSGTGETMVSNASALKTIIINHNASNAVKVTNVIYGHTHSDIYSEENGVKYFGTGASGVYMGMRPAPAHTISYYKRPAREKFTVTEALFDIYSVTPETTKRIRFGAGESQTV